MVVVMIEAQTRVLTDDSGRLACERIITCISVQSTHVTKTGLKQVTPCAIAAARSLMPPAPLLQSMGGWLGVWWCNT